MDTFLTFLDNNWPLVIALTTAVVGVAWGLFKQIASASENQIDDAIVRAIEGNPQVVEKLATKVEQAIADKLFAPAEQDVIFVEEDGPYQAGVPDDDGKGAE